MLLSSLPSLLLLAIGVVIFTKIPPIRVEQQLFNEFAVDVKIDEETTALFQKIVSSVVQCCLVCQRYSKCVFAQVVPQEKSKYQCHLFDQIENVITKLSEHNGSRIFQMFRIVENSENLFEEKNKTSFPSECLDWYEKGYKRNGIKTHFEGIVVYLTSILRT